MTPKETCEQKTRTQRRPRRWRFSIGSAPLTSITK
ncbi:TPA: plasmid replication initiation protein, partial [Escherichia coli]|nr:plasmid replication initiation protein [Escherichia coli]